LNTYQRDQSNYELRIIFIAANLNSNVKNLKSLFEALIELLSNQTILKIKLTLVGGGKIDLPPITSSLRIILKESLSPNQVLREFEQQDLCIVPSLSENRPNVIVESMLSGVFVIASKVGGIPEMVEDDVTGYTCDPNRTGILEAIRRYSESSESKKRGIINVAYERASKEHQPVKIVQEHERIYRESYNSWSS
jgi:glycosyltransferase involved in cell wall biosynthesis